MQFIFQHTTETMHMITEHERKYKSGKWGVPMRRIVTEVNVEGLARWWLKQSVRACSSSVRTAEMRNAAML